MSINKATEITEMKSEYIANIELQKDAKELVNKANEQLFNERKPVKFDEEKEQGKLAEPSSWSIV